MSDTLQSQRFLGLHVSTEVNVLALVAFCLSIGSLGLQAWQYLRGPQVTMNVGERINLVRRDKIGQSDTPPFLVVNARMNYVNSGALGRDTIITDERLDIRFDDGTPHEYRWLHFEMIVANAAGGPSAESIDGAHPDTVPGSGALSHQTTFVAFPEAPVRPESSAVAAAVTWNTLMLNLSADTKLSLTFHATDADGGKHDHRCTVQITEGARLGLIANGWTTALCFPS